METHLGAMVDLQQSADFEEPFYIVVLEKSNKNTIVHMWRLVIASQPDNMGKNKMCDLHCKNILNFHFKIQH